MRPLEMPPSRHKKLENGLSVRVSERPGLPEVVMCLAVRAGAGHEDPGRAGLADLTGNLLDQSAGPWDAEELARSCDRLGLVLRVYVGHDATTIVVHCLNHFFEEALERLAVIVQEPRFEDDDVARVRRERIARWVRRRQEPATVAEERVWALAFGGHPYGRPAYGRLPDLAHLDAKRVRTFHRTCYGARGAVLAICGDVDAGRVFGAVQERFADWQEGTGRGPLEPLPPARPRAGGELPVTIVDGRAGATQAEVRVGALAPPHGAPDLLPLQLADAVLGGLFNSRLNLKLREDKGWCYRARTRIRLRRLAGLFVAQTAVDVAYTSRAVKVLLDEVRDLGARPPADREIRLARRWLAGSLHRKFETNGQVARRMVESGIYGLSESYWSTYGERLEAVTPEDVSAAVGRYLSRDRLAIVVVGDADRIEKRLEGFGAMEVHRGPDAAVSSGADRPREGER